MRKKALHLDSSRRPPNYIWAAVEPRVNSGEEREPLSVVTEEFLVSECQLKLIAGDRNHELQRL